MGRVAQTKRHIYLETEIRFWWNFPNHLAILIKQEDDMTITWFQRALLILRRYYWTLNDISLVSAFKYRNPEPGILPPKIKVSLPSFTPLRINKENLHKQHNVCQQCRSKTNMATKWIFLVLSPFPRRNRSKIPHIISNIETRYGGLFFVYCVSDKDLWTCVNDSIISLYDLKVELVRSIPSKVRK